MNIAAATTMTPASFMEHIQAMLPALRERAPEAERNRQIPRTSIDELRAAGLFRVFQPARFGGSELPMAAVRPLITEVATACPSTAWVLAVLQIHEWVLGLFPDTAQDDVFADDADTLLAGVLQPRVTAMPVAGGYQLGEASWPYGSGCDFGAWAILGGLITVPDGPPEPAMFLLPKSDWQIVDDWHVIGLRGTGSKSFAIGGAVVPDHRVVRYADAIAGRCGQARRSLYKSAFVPMLCLNVTGPAIGAARTAITAFQSLCEQRNLPFSMEKMIASGQTHRRLGEVMLRVDEAELLLRQAAAEVEEAARAGHVPDVTTRTRLRAYCSAAVRQCVDAIETLYLASGGSALQESHPLQQLNRDAKGMALHAALTHDNNLELWGAASLAQPLTTPFV